MTCAVRLTTFAVLGRRALSGRLLFGKNNILEEALGEGATGFCSAACGVSVTLAGAVVGRSESQSMASRDRDCCSAVRWWLLREVGRLLVLRVEPLLDRPNASSLLSTSVGI
jgi:hypothetical protein